MTYPPPIDEAGTSRHFPALGEPVLGEVVHGDHPRYPSLDPLEFRSSFSPLDTLDSCDSYARREVIPAIAPSAPYYAPGFTPPVIKDPTNLKSYCTHAWSGVREREPINRFHWGRAREIPQALMSALVKEGKAHEKFDPWNLTPRSIGTAIQNIANEIHHRLASEPVERQIEAYEKAIQYMHDYMDGVKPETRGLIEVALRKALTQKFTETWPAKITFTDPMSFPPDFSDVTRLLNRFITANLSFKNPIDTLRLLADPILTHAIDPAFPSVSSLAEKTKAFNILAGDFHAALDGAGLAPYMHEREELSSQFKDKAFQILCDQESQPIIAFMNSNRGHFPPEILDLIHALYAFYQEEPRGFPSVDPSQMFLKTCFNGSSSFTRLSLIDKITVLEESLQYLETRIGSEQFAAAEPFLRHQLLSYLASLEHAKLSSSYSVARMINPDALQSAYEQLAAFGSKRGAWPLGLDITEALIGPMIHSVVEDEFAKVPFSARIEDKLKSAERSLEAFQRNYERFYPTKDSSMIVDYVRKTWSQALWRAWSDPAQEIFSFQQTGQLRPEFFDEARKLDMFMTANGAIQPPFYFITSKVVNIFGDLSQIHNRILRSYHLQAQYIRLRDREPSLYGEISSRLDHLQKQRETMRWATEILSPTSVGFTPPPGYVPPVEEVRAESPILPSATDVRVRYDAPLGHALFIRGSGAGLSWDKGLALQQSGDGTWKLPIEVPAEGIEYKMVYDDQVWEEGSNHRLLPGREEVIVPRFNLSAPLMAPIVEESPVRAPTTDITVRYDAPLGHTLFIRGSGAGLSWDKGLALQQSGDGTWKLPIEVPAEGIEYKIVYDDQVWEEGSNHKLLPGREEAIAPRFKLSASQMAPMIEASPAEERREPLVVSLPGTTGAEPTLDTRPVGDEERDLSVYAPTTSARREPVDRRSLLFLQFAKLEAYRQRMAAHKTFEPKQAAPALEAYLVGERDPTDPKALLRKDRLVRFCAFGNSIAGSPCLLTDAVSDMIRTAQSHLMVPALAAMPRTEREILQRALPELKSKIVLDSEGKRNALDLLCRYYREAPYSDPDVEEWIRAAGLDSDKKFLAHIYAQAIDEGIKIESWDRRWPEFHWHKNIPRCVQALQRYVLAR